MAAIKGRKSLRLFSPCFSTLGCPELSHQEACSLAKTFEIDFSELRFLEDLVDIPDA
jgi:hypothetical protein